MTKWEYTSLRVSANELSTHLDRMGNEGWEAYQVLDGGSIMFDGMTMGAYNIFLKRPKALVLG